MIKDDIGANGGRIVTTIGFQEAAAAIAQAEKIGMATLNPDATETDYMLRIADQLFRGMSVHETAKGTDAVYVVQVEGDIV